MICANCTFYTDKRSCSFSTKQGEECDHCWWPGPTTYLCNWYGNIEGGFYQYRCKKCNEEWQQFIKPPLN